MKVAHVQVYEVMIRLRASWWTQLTWPFPDECVSSWAHRNGVDIDFPEPGEERDFGKLKLELSTTSNEMRRELRRAAVAPDAWVLCPRYRTLLCPRCMVGDWASTRYPYLRRAWAVGWRTCCPKHGALVDSRTPSVSLSLSRALAHDWWEGKWLQIWKLQGGRRVYLLELAVHDDRRAIHLEDALSRVHGEGANWNAFGGDAVALRRAYIAIVMALLNQFAPCGEAVNGGREAMEEFECLPNPMRYAINVLAEAIISHWRQVPLPPADAQAFRTDLLAHAIGWGRTPLPCVNADHVLLHPPHPAPTSAALRACAKRMRVDRPIIAQERTGFTRREAAAVGLMSSAFELVAQMCDDGRGGRMDQEGKLSPRPDARPLSTIDQAVLDTYGVELPPWTPRALPA